MRVMLAVKCDTGGVAKAEEESVNVEGFPSLQVASVEYGVGASDARHVQAIDLGVEIEGVDEKARFEELV